MKKHRGIFYQLYVWKRIFEFEGLFTLIYVLAALVAGLLIPVEAFAFSKLIDAAVKSSQNTVSGNSSFIIFIIIVSAVLFVTKLIHNFNEYISSTFDLRQQNLRDKIASDRLLKVQPHYYEDATFIKLKNKVDYNLWKISNSLKRDVDLVSSFIISLFTISFFLFYDVKVALIVILSLVFPTLVTLKYGHKLWGIWDSLSNIKVIYEQYRNAMYVTDVGQFSEIKVFGYGSYIINKALAINKKFVDSLEENEKKRFLVNIISAVWEIFFTGICLYLIFTSFITSKISIGQFYLILTLFGNLKSSVAYFFDRASAVLSEYPFLQSFYEFFNYEPELKVIDGNKVLQKDIAFSIELKDVWFKYPGTEVWVLKGINLKIPSMDDVALVGKNGAGKTTIIKLILRIYDPDKGDILINGENIKKLKLEDYYKTIGILSQMFNTYRITAWENIYIGNVESEIDKTKIQEAAISARADEFIQKYPQKYDTYLTRELKDGTLPSGGQWQRLGIARVLYRNPSLIILDEPTSAIDALAEEEIFTNLRNLAKEKTVLMISHRFATVKRASYIYVVDGGEVVEEGTHEGLLNKEGLYKDMYKAQND